MVKKISIFMFLLLGLMSQGEVYLLAPFSKDAKGAKTLAVDSISNSRQLLSEPIVFNGVETMLDVYLVETPLDQLLEELRSRLGELEPIDTPGGIAISLPLERGWKTTLLLFGSELGRNVTVFAMKLPEKMPTTFDWPEELPLPSNAKPVTVMHFEKSGGYYGSFNNGGDRRDMMLEVSSALNSRGFQPQTGEGSVPDESYGELFIHTSPMQILQLKLTDDGEGVYILRSKK